MKTKKSVLNAAVTYTYPASIIHKFRNSSTEWKLNWLEEVNNLTNKVLTGKEKAIRNKIRQGKVTSNEHLKEHLKSTPAERLEWLEEANKFVSKIRSAKAKALNPQGLPHHLAGQARIAKIGKPR